MKKFLTLFLIQVFFGTFKCSAQIVNTEFVILYDKYELKRPDNLNDTANYFDITDSLLLIYVMKNKKECLLSAYQNNGNLTYQVDLSLSKAVFDTINLIDASSFEFIGLTLYGRQFIINGRKQYFDENERFLYEEKIESNYTDN